MNEAYLAEALLVVQIRLVVWRVEIRPRFVNVAVE